MARLVPGFGESTIQFALICQVNEFVERYLAPHALRKRILGRLRAEGIRIASPLRETFQVPPSRPDMAVPTRRAPADLRG